MSTQPDSAYGRILVVQTRKKSICAQRKSLQSRNLSPHSRCADSAVVRRVYCGISYIHRVLQSEEQQPSSYASHDGAYVTTPHIRTCRFAAAFVGSQDVETLHISNHHTRHDPPLRKRRLVSRRGLSRSHLGTCCYWLRSAKLCSDSAECTFHFPGSTHQHHAHLGRCVYSRYIYRL
jgi:hypothetical protein